MSLDLLVKRADHDEPVTALTLYACVTPGCQHDALREVPGTRRDEALRALLAASREEIVAANLTVREAREHLGSGRDGRLVHLPAGRCTGGCGERRVRLARTGIPEEPEQGRAALRAYLTDQGIEPRGL